MLSRGRSHKLHPQPLGISADLESELQPFVGIDWGRGRPVPRSVSLLNNTVSAWDAGAGPISAFAAMHTLLSSAASVAETAKAFARALMELEGCVKLSGTRRTRARFVKAGRKPRRFR